MLLPERGLDRSAQYCMRIRWVCLSACRWSSKLVRMSGCGWSGAATAVPAAMTQIAGEQTLTFDIMVHFYFLPYVTAVHFHIDGL